MRSHTPPASTTTASTSWAGRDVTEHPTTVDEYVAAQPHAVQGRLATIRRIVAEEVPGATETIRYHMPTFGDGERSLIHVAAWKRHIGLYPVPVFEGDLEAEVAPLRAAKDTVTLLHRHPFPDDLFRRVVRAIASGTPDGTP
jgi:uncharacterized protein YdhG (YjbR/CyaY superfamily)